MNQPHILFGDWELLKALGLQDRDVCSVTLNFDCNEVSTVEITEIVKNERLNQVKKVLSKYELANPEVVEEREIG